MSTPPLHPKPSDRTFATVIVSTAADGTSDLVDITGLHLATIQMSTAWTDAAVGFKASVDGTTTLYDVYNSDGTFLTVMSSANRVIAFNPAVFTGIQKLQLVSETTAGVAVAQAAARTVKLGLF